MDSCGVTGFDISAFIILETLATTALEEGPERLETAE
jgi:hypothetical protein